MYWFWSAVCFYPSGDQTGNARIWHGKHTWPVYVTLCHFLHNNSSSSCIHTIPGPHWHNYHISPSPLQGSCKADGNESRLPPHAELEWIHVDSLKGFWSSVCSALKIMIEVLVIALLIAQQEAMLLTADLAHLHCVCNVPAVAFTCQGKPCYCADNTHRIRHKMAGQQRDAAGCALPWGFNVLYVAN